MATRSRKELEERIFDPFFTTKGRGEGKGYGYQRVCHETGRYSPVGGDYEACVGLIIFLT
jgi:hypothetical protein